MSDITRYLADLDQPHPEGPAVSYADHLTHIAKLEAETNQLRELIMWALGEGGRFPDRPANWNERKYTPWFWWRTELRRRFNAISSLGSK